jgi:hypothetical protein
MIKIYLKLWPDQNIHEDRSFGYTIGLTQHDIIETEVPLKNGVSWDVTPCGALYVPLYRRIKLCL